MRCRLCRGKPRDMCIANSHHACGFATALPVDYRTYKVCGDERAATNNKIFSESSQKCAFIAILYTTSSERSSDINVCGLCKPSQAFANPVPSAKVIDRECLFDKIAHEELTLPLA
jgi:hypothetical protein